MRRSCGCPMSHPLSLAALLGVVGVTLMGGLSSGDDADKPAEGDKTAPAASQTPEHHAQRTTPVAHYNGIPEGFSATASFDPKTDPATLKTATFGGGCFWGTESVFRAVPGVTHTAVGFCGGDVPDPSYKQVVYTETGHAEVVEMLYDPARVSYDELLKVFWAGHDPTQVNRQGPDIGEQYRTVIFFHDQEQREQAERSRTGLGQSSAYVGRPIATKIEPAGPMYPAEEYHQQYLEKKGLDSCHLPTQSP